MTTPTPRERRAAVIAELTTHVLDGMTIGTATDGPVDVLVCGPAAREIVDLVVHRAESVRIAERNAGDIRTLADLLDDAAAAITRLIIHQP